MVIFQSTADPNSLFPAPKFIVEKKFISSSWGFFWTAAFFNFGHKLFLFENEFQLVEVPAIDANEDVAVGSYEYGPIAPSTVGFFFFFGGGG